MTRIRHIATIDTREQTYIDGKGYRGVAGTGEALPCHCCGRTHEVHALLVEEIRTGDVGSYKWARVRDLNYGVSCARKVATVHAGVVLENCDRERYGLYLTRARMAA